MRLPLKCLYADRECAADCRFWRKGYRCAREPDVGQGAGAVIGMALLGLAVVVWLVVIIRRLP